jgi:hypothetical protein
MRYNGPTEKEPNMLVLIHKAYGSAAVEVDSVPGEILTIPVEEFPFTCFTCLDEIERVSELRISEQIRTFF